MADGYYRARAKAKSRSSNEAATVTAPTKVIINKKFFGDPSLWSDQPLSNMYNNSQYSAQGYNNYTQYPQNYNSNYGYDGYNQGQYISTTVQPVPPGEEYPQNNWAPVGGYHSGTNVAQTSTYETKNEDEGVAQERKAQNAQLIKQREDYVRKARVLRRELELLRNQKHEIMSENSSQRDMELILKENVKLQDEIQTKMKAIHNVIEMLSSIIKDGKKISDLEAQLDESPKPTHKNHKTDNDAVKYNYMHYDPELHWCRMCDEFPKTAKDFLLHLQGDKHRNNIQENDVGDNTPWHKLAPEPELPYHEGAQKKRIPIRGLQFFISAPAWYCKLCDTWIGDLHCASHHLKSQAHFQNYANFVEQNPHWEIEWLKDREKAMARNERHGNSSDSDQVSEKRKKRHRNKRSSMDSSNKDKKKKKRSKKRRKHSSDTSSSSSSSDSSSDDEPSDKSKSIRVVMRNMKVQSIMNEDLSGKWEMLERLVDEHKKKEEMKKEEMQKKDSQKKEPEDKLINQWMTVSEPQDKEKALLGNLKDRMKQKQELERAKYAEMEKRQREKEREEKEKRERKEREEREAKERYEREKREREREEYERIRDKERNQVKFKATRDREHYRKRKTPSPSPERTKESPRVEQREPSVSRERKESQSSNNENGRQSEERRSRSASQEKKPDSEKKPPAKRLPFIGRMPLFKNKKVEERVERKEIKKEEYDIPRKSRFQPGNLAKAFLPSPDVVCYPKLSCIPELTIPPPPMVSQPDPPDPPKISEDQPPKAPPAPKIGPNDDDEGPKPKRKRDREQEEIEEMYGDPSQFLEASNNMNMMGQYYQDYSMMYSQMYEYQQEQPPQPPPPPDDVPLSHTMPLQPPPLPPSDPNEDLAMLGISADDMAAQSF